LGDASAFDYERVIKTTIDEKEIGAIVVLLTPQANTQIKETAEVLAKMQRRFKEPIYPIFMGKKSMTGVGRFFEEERIVGFANFDYLTGAIKKIVNYRNHSSRKEAVYHPKIAAGLAVNKNAGLAESLKIINDIGIATAEFYRAESATDIEHISDRISFPVVAKVSSRDVIHKTEVGGVVVDIKTKEKLIENYRNLSKISKTVVVQEMVKGYELIVGAKRDPKFGVVVALGLGGIYTELIKDISFRLHPLSFEEFEEMVKETRASKLFKGFRGSKPGDTRKIYEVLSRLGAFMELYGSVKEIEINPLMISGDKITAVDARIIA
jgi:acetyltransferase